MMNMLTEGGTKMADRERKQPVGRSQPKRRERGAQADVPADPVRLQRLFLVGTAAKSPGYRFEYFLLPLPHQAAIGCLNVVVAQ
jgi:hypothetical protein